jgi:hypothetical protein
MSHTLALILMISRYNCPSVQTVKAYLGTAAVLTRNLDAVFPVKITSSHCICLDPGASLDDLEKRQPFGSTGIRTTDCQDRSLITTLTLIAYCILELLLIFRFFRGCECRCTVRQNIRLLHYPTVTPVGVVIQPQTSKIQISHK